MKLHANPSSESRVRPWGHTPTHTHTGARADGRRDEASRRFSQSCERAMRMRRVLLSCGLSGTTIFFHIV
jgi:hypothetical protein